MGKLIKAMVILLISNKVIKLINSYTVCCRFTGLYSLSVPDFYKRHKI
ncbi:putative orphan protein [Pseudoalteromonas translucida]|uniref:Orphan protein n=1 Tax=Pseudoalteromonas translucida (strain TAC 125) TaxID=326442 RepID=Q3ICF5_PSET1|nr:putative orphan protein [Pseudoalteromonas translucida]